MRSVNRADDVYLALRTKLVRGEIRPNERLVEAELAESLNVSRTPVRESLTRLAAEGFVFSRRRGWVAREHTPAEIRAIYECRAALEGYASRLAAERASNAALAGIERIHRTSRAGSTRQHLVQVNDRFHDAILESSGNERMVHLAKSNREYYFNYRIATTYTDEETAASLAEHQRLVRALIARDGPLAERITQEHIIEGLRIILQKLRYIVS